MLVETHAGTVAVNDTGGAGAPVLLVHSLLVGGDVYHHLVPLLVERGYRCVVPELPLGAHRRAMRAGADLTPPGLARMLVDVLDGIGVDRAHVIGVDTGGALTQLLMAHHRDRVDRVILTACDAYDAFPPRSFGVLFPLLRVPGSLRLLARLAQTGVGRRLATLRPRGAGPARRADRARRRPRARAGGDTMTGSRLAAGTALTIGATAALAPGLLAWVVGLPAADMTGGARLFARWFGIRTAAVGAAALAGHRPAQLAIPLLQVPDQLVMVHALTSGSVPRRPTLTALAISWGLLAASGLAWKAEHASAR